ncbi:LOW QUALITY PROTEIN: protein wntless homolog [Liolophura sinensis]|uniref:LOW QUALITY PROTEIN: protein wntless homolog n=1 Tax=Liolophura sinensis TaxID=3198878 RepID=UPI0031598257
MAGVVLENLSSRKLYVLAAGLFLLLAAFFFVGAIIAPSPSNVQQILGTNCILPRNKDFWEHWSFPRGTGECEKISSFDDKIIQKEKIVTQDVVFSFLIPGVRDNSQLTMTPWFQTILGILMMELSYNPQNETHDDLRLELKLGYRSISDEPSDWKSLANSTESRKLECTMGPEEKVPGARYHCSMLSLFELGSCAHELYLLNLRIPTHRDLNKDIGELKEITLVVIHQNGGFTKVWFSLKTVMFPVVLIALIWYWRRIRHLNRDPTLLEKTLFALGITITFLNFPVEWLSIWTETPFMLLYVDIRQGLFSAMLLSFWLIFVGEHSMDQIQRKTLASYWVHLSAVAFGCIAMFVFEMCERGIQLKNPFFSIWVTDVGRNMALAFIIIAGISACLYFLFLSYMIYKVFRNISAKKMALPSMSSARRKYYSGIIYRFKFLMITTLLCAALTVIFFILSQVQEGHGHWEKNSSLEYTSGFFTGVYGMWNVYVLALLALYAPSHKYIPEQESDDSREEELQLTNMPPETSMAQSEGSAMSALVSKVAAD